MHHRRGSGGRVPAAGGFGGLAAKPPKAGRFFEKQAILNAIGLHFARVQGHLKTTRFLTFESQLKKLNCLILLLLTV